MKLIATGTVTGSATDLQFSNIPQAYDDLYILAYTAPRITGSNIGALVLYPELSYNTNNWTQRTLEGNGSSVTSSSFQYSTVGYVQYANFGTNKLSSSSIYIPNYKSSVAKNISWHSVTENNATAVGHAIGAANLNFTSPITFLGFGDGSAGGGLGVGTTISIYGIAKGSDGIVTTSP